MSYLDDADHTWQLDPAAVDDDMTLDELIMQIRDRDWDGLRIILQGYAGLKQRLPNASDEECLCTSIIWYFG